MDNGASSYRRFLDGDDSAFDEIMKELFDKLVMFVNCYVRDLYAAEEIAIDTFSDLVVYRHRYNFKVTLKTYLFMIGRCRALNYIKRRKKTAYAELDTQQIASDAAAEPDRALFESESKKELYSALEQLPDDMRAAVTLVYFEEMSYEEAAKIMKKSRKQIDNLLYRGKKQMRVLLEREGDISL